MPYPSTYKLSFELSIISKTSDDGLQILEQILPFFQPEYTVTVYEIDKNFRTDMPFTLTSVNLSDDYEGDFSSRRSIIYTLSFETTINYFGPYNDKSSIIKSTKSNLSDSTAEPGSEPLVSQRIAVSPQSASENDPYTIETTYEPKVYEGAILYFDSVTDGPITEGEVIIGQESGTTAIVADIEPNSVKVLYPDETFTENETIIGTESNATFDIVEIEPIWNSRE